MLLGGPGTWETVFRCVVNDNNPGEFFPLSSCFNMFLDILLIIPVQE